MVKIIKRGDIFASDCKYLVVPVNCVGAMGSGMALMVKRQNNKVYECYRNACKEKRLKPGKILHTTYNHPNGEEVQNYIFFPTKDHWRNGSKIEWIEAGMKQFLKLPKEKRQKMESIAIPKLGCGNGGLLWKDVKPIILGVVEKIDEIRWVIYE